MCVPSENSLWRTDVPLSAAGLANPDALFQNAIFRGDFLDTRLALRVFFRDSR